MMILETLREFCLEHTFVPVLKKDCVILWLFGGEDLFEQAVIGGDIVISHGGVVCMEDEAGTAFL